jgi:hypothetical protein
MPEHNGLVYDDEMSGRLRLYVFDHNGNHRGGLLFGPDVTFPDLPVASARRHAEGAMAAGREVRITNGSDHLVCSMQRGTRSSIRLMPRHSGAT